MIIYDFYDREKYHQITYECSREIKQKKEVNNSLEAFIALLELSQTDENFSKKYPIDNNGCLFYLICKYATEKKSRKIIETMPQVEKFKIERNKKIICTIIGNAEFELYLKNPLDILLKYLETDVKKLKTLKELYDGKLYQYCHYASLELGKNYDIVSAFVPGKFKNHRFVHSYLERDNNIYDVSNNIVMNKDDYYSLLTPEEILKISGDGLYKIKSEEIQDTYIDLIEKTLKKR